MKNLTWPTQSQVVSVTYTALSIIYSINKIGFWFEANAIDESGKCVIPVQQAVHKIAHGLHLPENSKTAHEMTFADKVKQLVKSVSEFEKPLVCQGE